MQMESRGTQSISQSSPEAKQARTLYLVVALVGVAVAIFLVIWVVGRDGGNVAALPAVGGGPAAVSTAQLHALAAKTGDPVYWAGSRDGSYELTRTSNGRTYVRYLPSADAVGDPAAKYLTIGTYPQQNAFRSIRRAAARPGAVSLKLPHGGLLVFNQQAPKSVYVGYPGAAYQVEVFDPSPAQARTLVLAGKITPIDK
jgi:hypothetical protein